MDTTKDTAHPAPPSTDDTVEAHYTGLECALCYRDLVYIGRLELTEEGEVVEPVPCRRCAR